MVAVDSTPAVDVKGLQCGYGETTVLTDVTFQVRRGEIFFIVGGSGCGKTTLLRCLFGLNRPEKGSVRLLGQPFSEIEPAVRRDQLKKIGVLFQSGALWSNLTLRENVALPLEEHTNLPHQDIDAIATFKLWQVGLSGFEEHYPSEISGGMSKRVGLARAMALDPAIVFFDEPWAGLDPVGARSLHLLVRQIHDTFGTTMVIVSHELAAIFDLADRLVMLEREARGIIAEGSPIELLRSSTDERVREFLQSVAKQPA
jgi:phospholipid/cholesterol/gamma-HCH transport system ATP-binding protein